MSSLRPHKLWWTAEEMAEARLPDLPGSKRGVNLHADQHGWRSAPGCARRKSGRGGGWEYHWSVLPMSAQKKLLLDAAQQPAPVAGKAEAWHVFDRLPQKVKDKARARLEVIRNVEALYRAGEDKTPAVHQAAQIAGVSQRTVHEWFSMIEGVAEEDRLAYLPPKHRMATRKSVSTQDVKPFMDFLQSSFLRIAPQTFKQCYRKAVAEAKRHGWGTLTERTAKRRLEKAVPRVSRVFLQEGVAGLERCFPAQIRDRTSLGAMGGVNADCHKIDVFVEWPDGTINRPQIIAFQDLYSNKFLSWRVDNTPNSVMVMAAFGEMIEKYGIPKKCLFDNGREFANKWMTGGAPTRFRFKIRDDDPLGVLPLLGIDIHWATPASGQSKPIERAFKDLANNIAKDPRFSGAYVGNRPDAKPENYGSRAIPSETFLRVFEEGMLEHNAREGRLTDAALGRSFDETFAESYSTVPIRKATEEQKRLYLMGQHVCKLNKQNGSIKYLENIYHSDWMSQHPSRSVVARFDPENLWEGLSIYDADGSYLGFAECQQKIGFFDVASASKLARRKARIKRKERDLAKEYAQMSPEEVGKAYDAQSPAPTVDLNSKVVTREFRSNRPEITHQKPVYTPSVDPAIEAEREAMIHQLPVKPEQKVLQPNEEAERFWQARDIIKRSEAGEPIGREEAQWVTEYVKTGEYEGLLSMLETFGKDAIV